MLYFNFHFTGLFSTVRVSTLLGLQPDPASLPKVRCCALDCRQNQWSLWRLVFWYEGHFCPEACRAEKWKEKTVVTQDSPIWLSPPHHLCSSYTAGTSKCLMLAKAPLLGKNNFIEYLGFSEFFRLIQITSCRYGIIGQDRLLLVFLRPHFQLYTVEYEKEDSEEITKVLKTNTRKLGAQRGNRHEKFITQPYKGRTCPCVQSYFLQCFCGGDRCLGSSIVYCKSFFILWAFQIITPKFL